MPGYVTIVAYLALFRSDILFSTVVSFDIFSSVVFIVAGPALGLLLLQLHRDAIAIISRLRSMTLNHKEYDAFLAEYAAIRVRMTSDEKLEFDETEAIYDFSVSTGLGLFGLSSLVILERGWFRLELVFLLAGAVILVIGGYLQWMESYSPMFDILKKKYARSR